jgi:dihydrolipoamide dehydrogenase
MARRTVDCIIIGSGQGGTSLAANLAQQGKRVTLFERDRLGGSCVNYGCTPSKAMLAPAHAIGHVRWARRLGVEADIKPDFARIMKRVRRIRSEWREGVGKVREVENLEVLEAEAAFAGPRTVSGGSETREAKRIVINTGMSAVIPPIDGLAGTPYLTNNNVFDVTELPPRLCVLGGGYIGLEIGQALARFGSEVTITDRNEHVMSRESRQVSHTLEKSFREEGVRFRLGETLTRVEHNGKLFRLSFDKGESMEAEALLVAAGRTPNTKALHPDRAGVELDDDGLVRIDEFFRTTAEGIYAIGDCAGQPPFTHVSSEGKRRLQAVWQAEDKGDVAQAQRRRDDRTLAYAVFTDPSVGRVGMDEEQAKQAGHRPVVHRQPLAETARGKEWGLTCGYFEIVLDKKSGRVLGATFVGYEASEMAQLFLPIVEQRLTWEAVGEAVFVHPTFGEDIMMLARKGA